jgi:hypothetical protein
VAVAAEVAVVEPVLFVAVTLKRIVWPTSALVRTYEVDVAPLIDPQPLPLVSQRPHWYRYVIEPPLQVPGFPVSVDP